eukprot:CAMPEP_0115533100 /NCGR_PEP_ID=MMETSP0271-20121206/85937_1 /TAXON_ID=71861 /ORGANISM="Scrippsiella trochoidea, Strain CCMP3099" /LENGTH=167 /DNA_ID=CAMNT_0002965451 /DNA_START=18 /DNA_END=521 /DNA_ORIENTATION=-
MGPRELSSALQNKAFFQSVEEEAGLSTTKYDLCSRPAKSNLKRSRSCFPVFRMRPTLQGMSLRANSTSSTDIAVSSYPSACCCVCAMRRLAKSNCTNLELATFTQSPGGVSTSTTILHALAPPTLYPTMCLLATGAFEQPATFELSALGIPAPSCTTPSLPQQESDR